ncbi:gp26 family baseplate hub assembly chaperone [bacterium]|nr:gp26 family baseplate hub assembly chaperone [bacterium]
MTRALTASQLLGVWEQGRFEPPVQRALLLLAAAYPETSVEHFARLSLGQRDAHLLALREWAFGSQLHSLVSCPQCGERLELNFNTVDLRAASADEPAQALALNVEGYEIQFRLPDSLDLVAISNLPDLAASRQQMLERCLLSVQQNGEARSVAQLPDRVIDATTQEMAQADPQADVQLALACPACGNQWHAAFDILSFFWNELHAWALRLLREVHLLASAYGWREADILSLSPWRRQFYLEMVSG